MIRRPPRSTPKPSSAASDVYKRQAFGRRGNWGNAMGKRGGQFWRSLPLGVYNLRMQKLQSAFGRHGMRGTVMGKRGGNCCWQLLWGLYNFRKQKLQSAFGRHGNQGTAMGKCGGNFWSVVCGRVAWHSRSLLTCSMHRATHARRPWTPFFPIKTVALWTPF